MCRKEITENSKTACDCNANRSLMSNAELIEWLREYREHLESELRLVAGKLKPGDTPGKEVRNVADTKEDSKKSVTLGKVVREIKTSCCDCACGCVPPLDKK